MIISNKEEILGVINKNTVILKAEYVIKKSEVVIGKSESLRIMIEAEKDLRLENTATRTLINIAKQSTNMKISNKREGD